MSTALDEADLEPPPPRQATTTERRRRRRRRGPALNNRAAAGVAACLVALGLSLAAWSTPSVRTVLRQSFTEQSDSFTELYFTGDPTFDGATLIVPVALNAHGTGVNSYQIRVALESPDGKTLATTTLNLTPRDGTPVPVVARLQTTAANAATVRVALVGHPQILHFRFGTTQTPNS